ncbi:MAG: lamin tail domain-containing protein [Planctomycetota bacterium]
MSSPRLPLHLALATLALGGLTSAQVVINEIQYDDSGTDDREYVELYNAGSGAVDISGWQLQSIDQVGPNVTYTVQAGTILAPGGYYVMGSGAVANVNQVLTGPSGGLWENDQETLELRDASGTILFDFVAYETNKLLFARTAQWEGEGLWGNLTSTDGTETSWSRIVDGRDTNDNGRDFQILYATPGATNNMASVLPYFDTYDSYTVDQPIPGWINTFEAPKAIDPLQASLENPNALPAASPAGGNAAIFWDSTGGGNGSTLLTAPTNELVFECYMYFSSTATPAGEYETSSVLLQGGTGTFHNHPDPIGEIGTNVGGVFTANGNTGVGLVYTLTENGGKLFLVDHNNGGWGSGAASNARVLGQINITAGVNDGWQRIRMQASNGLVECYFGGTLGQFDGTRMVGGIDGAIGGITFGYREFLVNNAASRPPTIDFLTIQTGNAVVGRFGNSTPHTSGTPVLDASSHPNIANPHFGFSLSSAPANSSAALIIGFIQLPVPFNLSLLGAQPGSTLLISADIVLTLATDANGNASFPLAIPNAPSLIGGTVFGQALPFDTGLGFPLPICQSQGLSATIGN